MVLNQFIGRKDELLKLKILYNKKGPALTVVKAEEALAKVV